MKVLMINTVCGIRSTGRICTDLATALEDQGHEVKIAYGRENVPEQFQKYAVRIGSDWDVKIHGIKSRILDGAGFGSKKATDKFIEWIKEYDPDVIHLHNIHGYYINVEVLFNYLKESGKKVIWTLHDCWAFTGHCVYFDYVGCDKWKLGCVRCPQKSEYPTSIGFDRSENNYNRKKELFAGIKDFLIVTPSEWLAKLVKQSMLSEYTIKVIHNGVDTAVFKPTPNNLRERIGLEGKRVILGVASDWNRRKGLQYFVELCNVLPSEYKIVLVGLSKEQINRAPQDIIGIERTNSIDELASLYSMADVFVNPTLEDNYPTTNLEAIACGTPVVTFNTGGSVESAKLYGIISSKGNLQDLVRAIEEALTLKKEVTREVLSKNQMVRSYLEEYEALNENLQ